LELENKKYRSQLEEFHHEFKGFKKQKKKTLNFHQTKIIIINKKKQMFEIKKSLFGGLRIN